MPFITDIFFLKPFPEKQEISLGHQSFRYVAYFYWDWLLDEGVGFNSSKLKIYVYMCNFSAFIFIPLLNL